MLFPRSLLLGIGLAPLLLLGLDLARAAVGSGADAHLLVLVSLGVSCLIASRVPVPTRFGTPWVGSALLTVGTGVALVASYISVPPAWLIALLFFPATTGAVFLFDFRTSLPGVLLGASVSILGIEIWLLPLAGYLPVTIVALLILIGIGISKRSTPSTTTLRVRWIDILVAGSVLGFFCELFRPFALQHLEGTRFSQIALYSVLLLGVGLGTLLPIPGKKGRLARLIVPAIGIFAIWRTTSLLGAVSDPIHLESFTSPGFPPALQELITTQALLGLFCVAAGLWLSVVLQSGRPSRCLGALALSLALGAATAHAVLDGEAPWPTAVADSPATWIRQSPAESLENHELSRDGLFREVRNTTRAYDATIAYWHGGLIKRPPVFASLEEEEIRFLKALHPEGGKLLLLGEVNDHHRVGLKRTSLGNHVGEIRLLPLEKSADGGGCTCCAPPSATDPDSNAGRYDIIALLSSPTHNECLTDLLRTSWIQDTMRQLQPGGSFVIFFDLRASSLDAIGATALSLQGESGNLRAWLLLDGFVGPFLALESGACPPVQKDRFRIEIPIDVLTDGTTAATLRSPAASTPQPHHISPFPLAPKRRLAELASRLEAENRVGAAALIRALSIHSGSYFNADGVNLSTDRHIFTDEECDELLVALNELPDHPATLNQIKRFVQLAYTKREYQRLDRVLLEALELLPEDPGLRFVSGRSALDLLDFETAVEEFETVARHGHMPFENYLLLGHAYAGLEDHNSAISSFHSALDLKPENLEAMRALGITLFEADRFSEAIPYLERVSYDNPSDGEVKAYLETIRAQ